MTISTNDGQIYEDELDYHFDRPMKSSSEDKNVLNPSSEPRQIYFVRHGDTNLNEESGEQSHDQPIRGWSKVSLNDDGRKEAQRAAQSVKDLGITHIVASDLPRAAETARIIGNKIGVTPEYNQGLRTWDLGKFTGKSGKDIHDQVDHYCKDAQDDRPPGSSESFNEFKDRILSTVSGIVQEHPSDHKILIVSHNSPERVLHAWTAAGQPKKKFEDLAAKAISQSTTDKIQTSPSNFGKRLDSNLQTDKYGLPTPNWREHYWQYYRDRVLSQEFPDAFPPSNLGKEAGIEDIGNFNPIGKTFNELDAENTQRHRQKDLSQQLGIDDIAESIYRPIPGDTEADERSNIKKYFDRFK